MTKFQQALESETQDVVREWEKRTGLKASVRVQLFDGGAHFEPSELWFGETDKFRVGPFSTLPLVLKHLSELYHLDC